MKNKIFLVCLSGIVAALGAIFIFKVPISNVFTFGFLLLCPLMHIFMMKGHGNHPNHKEEKKQD